MPVPVSLTDEHHVAAGLHGRMILGVSLVQVDGRGFKMQHAAVGHGIASINRQVQDYLPDLIRIQARVLDIVSQTCH